jgi:hypothetical protein
VPKGWNIAVTEANDEHIIVCCKKGPIVAGDGVVPAVTAPKKKTVKKAIVLPEKLVGPNTDAAFAPRVLNALVEPHVFKRCIPRPLDPAVGFWRIKVEILGGLTQHLQVRRDVYGVELLAQAFNGVDFSENDRVKSVWKPLKMEDGAVFKVEKVCLKSKLALTVHVWDGSIRRCGIEVSPTATIKEIVEQAQYKIDDERLEEPQIYVILHKGTPASQLWIQKEYELTPKTDSRGMVVVRSLNGDMTVPVPLFQKDR